VISGTEGGGGQFLLRRRGEGGSSLGGGGGGYERRGLLRRLPFRCDELREVLWIACLYRWHLRGGGGVRRIDGAAAKSEENKFVGKAKTEMCALFRTVSTSMPACIALDTSRSWFPDDFCVLRRTTGSQS
jgi:hypothetical protein